MPHSPIEIGLCTQSMTKETTTSTVYTCNEYREEMILLALQRKLQQPGLTPEEQQKLSEEIARLAEKIGM